MELEEHSFSYIMIWVLHFVKRSYISFLPAFQAPLIFSAMTQYLLSLHGSTLSRITCWIAKSFMHFALWYIGIPPLSQLLTLYYEAQ